MINKLKIRAWDKKDKEIKLVDYIDFKLKRVYLKEINRVDSGHEFEEVELMQSTGLFDRIGNEIFEGDIVRNFGIDFTPIYTEVFGMYMALNVKILKIEKENWRCAIPFNKVCVYGKLIGNIYENKELLEVK